MKRIWMIVSALALANVLALAGVVAWLQTSGRLNRERVDAVRQIFAVTLEQEKTAESQIIADQSKAAAEAAAEQRAAVPPETAAAQIAEKQLQAEKELQIVLRRQQELENLRSFLLKQLADLDRREQALEQARAAFAAEQARAAEQASSEQFKTALATLEAQRPRDAKAMLQALISDHQTEQVIAYLAEMDESKRGKIVAEFVKDEPSLAADLLERLRTRGSTGSAAAGESAATALPLAESRAEPGPANGLASGTNPGR